jgi:hypothetical protein
VKIQLHAFVTLTIDEGEWLASSPDRFTPWKISLGTRWRFMPIFLAFLYGTEDTRFVSLTRF